MIREAETVLTAPERLECAAEHSGILVPDQLFTVRYHYVDVTIKDQLCTTKVDQIFHNDTGVDREGMYVFPMPTGSAITRLCTARVSSNAPITKALRSVEHYMGI